MLRSRATQLLTAVSLAGIVLALPARPAQAQAGLTHLDDATMVPRGEWRLQAVTAWTRFNARFAPSGSGKTTIPLGADFTFDSLGTAQLPALAGTQNAIQALTGSPFKLTLGATSAATDARVVVMPMSLEYGLFHRLTLGAMIPLVRTRMNIMLRVNPLGTEANVGLNPAAVNLASLARDSSVVAQLTNAAAALQATLKSCQADAGSDPNCPQILANEQDVNTLLQSAASFTNAFAAVYGQSAQARGSAVVPLSGSAADNLVKARLVSYDSAFQSYLAGSAPRITSSPAAAGGPLGTADFGTLLHDPAIAGFDSVKSTIRIGVGDLELSARLLLFDQFDDSAVSANPAGLHARATLTGIYRVPTGQLAAAGNPLDIATGHGTSAAGARLAAYTQWGKRVGLSATASFMQSFGKTKSGAYPLALGAPFPPSTADVYPYTPGAVTTIEIAPRFMVTRLLGVSGLFDLQHVAANRYAGLSTGAGAPAATPLAIFDGVSSAPGTLQAAGFGITYSTVTEFERGRAALPIDVTFTHLEALSGAARMAKTFRDQIGLRFYYRRGPR